MINARLRRSVDSIDICQSVLASFFVRAALCQYQIESPAQLVKLLVSMARNKLTDQMRHARAGRRDNRRLEAGDVRERDLASAGPSPSQCIANRDLISEFRRRMSDEERYRSISVPWAGNGPRWPRNWRARPTPCARSWTALGRIAKELGLDNLDNE